MRGSAALVALACCLGAAAVVHADDKPWAQGVSAENQAKALELYRQGNELVEQARYLEAYEKYQVALAAWDHPSIRYNAAVCLINLGRADEAYENLMAALRFNGDPLSADLKRQAATYKTLLEGQLGELEVRCKEPDAKVLLDGKDLLACPGSESRRLRPGRHQVVGEKPGYDTDSHAIEVSAGKKLTVVLELHLLGSKGHLERRWPRWVPYAVLGFGGAVGIAAIPLGLKARSGYRAWDNQFTSDCPLGCDPSTLSAEERATLDDLDSTKKRSATIAYSAMAVGGAAIAVGFTLVLLNQPHLVGGAAVAPSVGSDHASLSLVGVW